MGWMWVLLAVVVVLVVAGLVVVRARGRNAGPDDAVTAETSGDAGPGGAEPDPRAHTPSPDAEPPGDGPDDASPSAVDRSAGPATVTAGERSVDHGPGAGTGPGGAASPPTSVTENEGEISASTPEIATPEAATPEIATSEAATPETAAPIAVDGDATDPDAAGPDDAAQGAAVPDAVGPDAVPTATGSDVTNPNAAAPDAAHADTVAPETGAAATATSRTADDGEGAPVSIPRQQDGTTDDAEPSGRHALRDGVAPQPLPDLDLSEEPAPPEPVTASSRTGRPSSGGSALAALDSRLIGPAAASDPVPEGSRPGPFPGSVLAPTDGAEPPESHRVKVHSGSRRFHTTESPYYVRTRADLYFTAEDDARAAGFIAWHERPGSR
ncbi:MULTISPECIES: hypothetical protein [unclassified Pseudonocardia]|uniref:sunset domain-containing protein n=1 Tax=unclassified Pseudonocardia TaxID=2619320 RepID=UPI0001FFDD5A|nr:hypothetical protein [Pseudonocardia sp. Ae707_Ps1]OLM20812.1 hypothetical protein Ae707Ps1_5071c [Pseudonocardia sp. Ae707_Ps1]